MDVSPTLSLEPTYLTRERESESDLAVWETESPAVAAYIQPVAAGARIYTVLADQSAPTRYDYELDVPEGTTLRENALGFMILDPNGNSLGQLHSPWARDSSGRELRTGYEWEDGTLTQVVDLSSPGIDYPVLMDPAWSYTHTKNITNRTPSEIRSKLLSCFNCYFPVEGAPDKFPSFKLYLPLVVRLFVASPVTWDFSCYMDTHHYETQGNLSWFGYRFLASSTHVDGQGSSIAFDFNPHWTTTDPTIRTQLVVSAYIVNDDPVGLGQPAYTIAATSTWNGFAANLDFS
ncbi:MULTISPECIES: hypothetical protein [unclassified Microbacterium]|uniref:hypothetical protein n=1 Tax=unclassified Microbacterium TaxID=2609290 RepID=UPI000EA9BD3A|nr:MULTISPECIES: hypothetical protein [unclassified Microbacterium]MBT2483825.1 hypothetical protein [Microbacterium sp. ISL-108]RKN66808.1 hypothetical protein D7252_03835 [Microbacterium sp. CGR2]